MKKMTLRETDFEERYIDDWIKAQAGRSMRGKSVTIKRADFYHDAIGKHSQYALQENIAAVMEAEFRRLHTLIDKLSDETEYLKFRLKALGADTP